MMDESSDVEVEDVSVPETSKVVDPRWTDWIHTLNRLNKLSEALLPAEFNPFKAKEAEKSRESSDDHHMPASDVTVAPCSCQIDRLVEMVWDYSIWEGSCMKLMELLKKYPCLLTISDDKGNTVLHIAAREGNLKLLVYTCSLFLDDLGNAVEEYVHGDNKIDRKAFFEKENDDHFTAKDCLWFTLGRTTMYEYFDNFVSYGKYRYDEIATLAAMQDEVFNPLYDDEHPVTKRLKDYADGTYEDNGGVDAKRRMKEIIIQEYNDRKEQLDQDPPTGSDSIAEYEELRFLHTLSDLENKFARVKHVKEEYLRAVIRGCVKEGLDVVKYLFRHRNAKGHTAFHCTNVRYCAMLIEEIPAGEEYKDCFNACDERGWTALHCATAKGDEDKVECLLKDTRVDVHAEMLEEDCPFQMFGNGVAIHLAIMHDHVKLFVCFYNGRIQMSMHFTSPRLKTLGVISKIHIWRSERHYN